MLRASKTAGVAQTAVGIEEETSEEATEEGSVAVPSVETLAETATAEAAEVTERKAEAWEVVGKGSNADSTRHILRTCTSGLLGLHFQFCSINMCSSRRRPCTLCNDQLGLRFDSRT
jgi:hypothetical protein